MSDKIQKIKEELERRVESMNSCLFKTAELGSEKFNDGELYAYKQILQFIDSLPKEPKCIYNRTLEERKESCKYCSAYCNARIEEPASEDLEEAAQEYSFNIPTQIEADSVWKKETEQHFKDGAKWHENKMKEALQTEYEKGLFDMRDEMMKTLVEGEIVKDIHNQLKVTSEPLNDAFGKFGDKVKIIICKTEQQ